MRSPLSIMLYEWIVDQWLATNDLTIRFKDSCQLRVSFLNLKVMKNTTTDNKIETIRIKLQLLSIHDKESAIIAHSFSNGLAFGVPNRYLRNVNSYSFSTVSRQQDRESYISTTII